MNRIILIGNGFDLAHGLKTSYADFIDWYWREWGNVLLASTKKLEEDRLCRFKLAGHISLSAWSFVWLYRDIINPREPDAGLKAIEKAKINRALCEFPFKSSFFQRICDKVENKKWVDIEDVFYDFLKKSLVPKPINDDLEFIKEKLIEYLNTLTEPTLNSIIRNQIFAPISPKDFAIGSIDKWEEMLKERLEYDENTWNHLFATYNDNLGSASYSLSSIKSYKNLYAEKIRTGRFDDESENDCRAYRLPDHIMLLNFNYTNTADIYLQTNDLFSVNHIHGSLSNPQSVIFGYGDEHDDEYQPLMKKNDNEYLRHIKSFRYLESSNYRKMLGFIELGPYQVCIMGHSCGISDRTLLSTLFEHPNCVSIKPYYYRDKDGKDNYFDLICNIARNISDPSLMRDRVVRKERCQTLGEE